MKNHSTRFLQMSAFFFIILLSVSTVYAQKIAVTFLYFSDSEVISRFDYFETEAEHIKKIKGLIPKECLRVHIDFREHFEIKVDGKYRLLKDTTLFMHADNTTEEKYFPIDFQTLEEVQNELVVRPSNYAAIGSFIKFMYFEETHGNVPISTENIMIKFQNEILRINQVENNHLALFTQIIYNCAQSKKENAEKLLKKMALLFPDKLLLKKAASFYDFVFDTSFFSKEELAERRNKYPNLYTSFASVQPESMNLSSALNAVRLEQKYGKNDFITYNEREYCLTKHGQYDSALVYAQKFLNFWENNPDSLLLYFYTSPLASYTTVAEVLWLQKRYEEGLQILDRGRYLTSESKSRLEMSELYANLGFHNLTALIYKDLGRIDTAFSIYENLVKEWKADMFKDSLVQLYPKRFPNSKVSFEDYYLGLMGKKVHPNAPVTDLFLLKGNEKITIGGEKADIFVLNFWGTYCSPCIQEFPLLNKLKENFAQVPDIKFISVTKDSPEALNNFFRKRDFRYQHAHTAYEAFRLYEANSVPVNLIIDKKGKIVFQHVGYDKKIIQKMSEVLEKLIVNGEN